MSVLNRHNSMQATWFLTLAVLVMLPALLFSSFMPGWAPPLALAGMAVAFLLWGNVTGRLVGHTPADGPILLLLLILPLGLWITADPTVSLPWVYALVASLAFFWVIAIQRDALWLRWSGWLLLLSGLILGWVLLLGTNFNPAKLPFINQEIYTALPGGLRPFWNRAGFNPNLSGGLLALFWAPAVVLAWKGESWLQRDAAKLVGVVLSGLVLLTQSRGALFGMLVALLVITSFQSRRWLWFWLVVLVSSMIGACYSGPAALPEALLGQSDLFGQASLQGRQELWQRAIYLIQDFPLTGVGLGMVEPAIKLLYPTSLIGADSHFQHAHNLYLQIGAEMGLPGLITHLALYLILFQRLLRQVRDGHAGHNQTVALGLLGSLITFLTHGLFEVITYAPRAAIVVWGLFGLMVAVSTNNTGANYASTEKFPPYEGDRRESREGWKSSR